MTPSAEDAVRTAADAPAASGVLFVLQPHFSLPSFSGAADALVTAALVGGPTRYRVATLAVTDEGDGGARAASAVVSDIGVAVAPTLGVLGRPPGRADAPPHDPLAGIDHVFVCGGYRCSLDERAPLSALLREADARGLGLGGLWNGVAALAHAGLLDGHGCALHPTDRETFAARFPTLSVRRRAVVVDRGRASAAGPAGALELMLALIGRRDGTATTRAVRSILTADAGPGGAGDAAYAEDDERSLPAVLATALELMRNNLDEPLAPGELAVLAGASVRTLERAFRERLETSPARHYLELRLQRAAELLAGDSRAIGEVARATGFGDAASFSRAFARRFGRAPRLWRRALARSGRAV